MVVAKRKEHALQEAMRRALQALDAGEGPSALRHLPVDAHDMAERLEISQRLALAGLFHKTRRFDQAEKIYLGILDETEHALALVNLGHIYHFTGRLTAAIDLRRRALTLCPQDRGLQRDLGCSLVFLGDKREGLALLREAALACDDPGIGSDHLFRLHHDDTLDLEGIYAAHRRWGRRFAPQSLQRRPHRTRLSHTRPLRIGYVSPDFRTHPVAFFFESLLDGHDPRAVEIYGYGLVTCPDETTKRLIPKFHCYRDILALHDDAALQQIETDGIDILVDLAGHAGGQRLSLFAAKAAPIQVSYCGYPDTTGMTQMDFRLVDALSTPRDLQRYHTEALVTLPETFLCYRPSPLAPPPTLLPAARRGFCTFGLFNNTSKVTDPMLRVWASLLRSLPQTRLHFKSRAGDDPEVQGRFRARFRQLGVEGDRLTFVGQVTLQAYYQQIAEVDIVLDTFPYHGTTTTCDALWMGVPVVTRLGEHHASRVGLSLLSQVGMGFCVAQTAEAYIEKARVIAGDLMSLAKIRSTLRARMEASPLCRPRRFAAHVEAAYRAMWDAYLSRI